MLTNNLSKDVFKQTFVSQRGQLLVGTVDISTRSGDTRFEHKIGKLAASEHVAVTDFTVFCPALQEAIALTDGFRVDIRVAVFRQEKAANDFRYLPNTYFLEILLRTSNAGEAVLSLKLEDFHYSVKRMDVFLAMINPMGFFHSAKSVSFATPEGAHAAQSQFEDICEDAIFLMYMSPNGLSWIRVLDFDLNEKFIQFLKINFEGACTFHPEGLI